jgi:hypothetical protein
MYISDYFIKVKNLVDALASIGVLVDDKDLMAMTLNGPEKYYSQFRTSIVIQKTFPDFQNLITLLISEEMRIVGTSSNEGSQENVFYSNYNRGRGGKTSFQDLHENLHNGHHQHKGESYGGGQGNFRRRGSHGGCGGSRGSRGSHRNHRSQQRNIDSNCYYCGKPGQIAKNYYQREHDA